MDARIKEYERLLNRSGLKVMVIPLEEMKKLLSEMDTMQDEYLGFSRGWNAATRADIELLESLISKYSPGEIKYKDEQWYCKSRSKNL